MATNAAPEPPPRLSEELVRLRGAVGERAVTLGEIVDTLGVRAYLVLLVLLSLPFITPIPLPFLSTPFGLAIGGIAWQLVRGKSPRLPARLRAKVLPPGFIGRLLAVAAGLIRFLEHNLRPRLGLFIAEGLATRWHAAGMLLAAGVLLLPLFVPLTNAFPALAILLIAAGLLERDGLAALAGHLMLVLGSLYFVLLGEGASQAVDWLKDRF